MTPRETPIRITITRGSLADELHQAERAVLDARAKLEDLLDSLFGTWGSFSAYDATIDVYLVVPSDAAVDALRRGGFGIVWLHPHAETDFMACGCRAR